MSQEPRPGISNGTLNPRRWQPRPALRDDLEMSPSLFDVAAIDATDFEAPELQDRGRVHEAQESNSSVNSPGGEKKLGG